MSNQQHFEARLPGFDGPYFPDEVGLLRHALDRLDGVCALL